MRVFLIHGMGRSRVSLMVLASRLKRAGHLVSLFGYSVARHDLDTIADRFVAHIESVLEDDGRRDGEPRPYAIIGHSLGNIITHIYSFSAALCEKWSNTKYPTIKIVIEKEKFNIATFRLGEFP